MRTHREAIAVLGSIYRLVGRGFNDQEIANELKITEGKVSLCVSWMLKAFDMPDRLDLVRHASAQRVRCRWRQERIGNENCRTGAATRTVKLWLPVE